MPSFNLVPVNGVIQSVTEFNNNCCMLMTAVRNSDGITNFVVSPDTYVKVLVKGGDERHGVL